MRMLAWTLLAACGAAAPPPAPAPRIAPVPQRPRLAYQVEAGELGDRDIEAKLVHHAYITRRSQGRLTFDTAAADGPTGDLPAAVAVPVLGEQTNFLRAVSTDDGARIAVWVPRESFAPTIVTPTELLDASGRTSDGVHGAWLAAGTVVGSPPDHGVLRQVTLVDHDLRVAGTVHENALGLVWRGNVPPPVPDNSAGKPPYLETTARIMAAARDDARVLATVVEMPAVTVVTKSGRWVEVVLERGGMLLRGYVHAADVTSERAGLLGHGSGTGSGYGVSDTDHVRVPAGACLYDRKGNNVIGVNLEDKERLGSRRVRDLSEVYVGTQYWGTMIASVKWVDNKIEMCTQ
ncbi:MAG TPA: hypothetical protein VFQ65_21305 [Kofleriaceae bacterium]|nr:hypothetical protein [Kofleriaceae bacterium]